MHCKSGFTLLEIIIATIILSVTILGLLGVFVSGNNWVLHFRERATSAELGRRFVDPLQMDVRQDTWATGRLRSGVIINPTERVNNKDFIATYNIADAAGDPALAGTDLRRVTTTVNWTEAATR